jgi:hypothetical protein
MRDDETEIEYMKRIALSCTEEEIWRAVFVSEVKLLFLKLMLELNFVDPAGADVFDLLPGAPKPALKLDKLLKREQGPPKLFAVLRHAALTNVRDDEVAPALEEGSRKRNAGLTNVENK